MSPTLSLPRKVTYITVVDFRLLINVFLSQIIATGSAAGSVRGQTGSSWVEDFQTEVKPVYNNETDSFSYQMELPDWCPPEVHNYKMLTIPATGRIATEPFFPADGPRDGVIVGLALDGKPIWSPNYQYDYGAYCDGGVITSILTDTCNEIMGLGYVKVGRLFSFFFYLDL